MGRNPAASNCCCRSEEKRRDERLLRIEMTSKAEQLLTQLKQSFNINNEHITKVDLKKSVDIVSSLKLEILTQSRAQPMEEHQLPQIKKQLLIARMWIYTGLDVLL